MMLRQTKEKFIEDFDTCCSKLCSKGSVSSLAPFFLLRGEKIYQNPCIVMRYQREQQIVTFEGHLEYIDIGAKHRAVIYLNPLMPSEFMDELYGLLGDLYTTLNKCEGAPDYSLKAWADMFNYATYSCSYTTEAVYNLIAYKCKTIGVEPLTRNKKYLLPVEYSPDITLSDVREWIDQLDIKAILLDMINGNESLGTREALVPLTIDESVGLSRQMGFTSKRTLVEGGRPDMLYITFTRSGLVLSAGKPALSTNGDYFWKVGFNISANELLVNYNRWKTQTMLSAFTEAHKALKAEGSTEGNTKAFVAFKAAKQVISDAVSDFITKNQNMPKGASAQGE